MCFYFYYLLIVRILTLSVWPLHTYVVDMVPYTYIVSMDCAYLRCRNGFCILTLSACTVHTYVVDMASAYLRCQYGLCIPTLSVWLLHTYVVSMDCAYLRCQYDFCILTLSVCFCIPTLSVWFRIPTLSVWFRIPTLSVWIRYGFRILTLSLQLVLMCVLRLALRLLGSDIIALSMHSLSRSCLITAVLSHRTLFRFVRNSVS